MYLEKFVSGSAKTFMVWNGKQMNFLLFLYLKKVKIKKLIYFL